MMRTSLLRTTQSLFIRTFCVCCLSLSLFACQTERPAETTIPKTEEEASTAPAKAQFTSLAIKKPFESISNPTQEMLVKNTAKAYTFRLKSGAYVKVPANAFQDAAGNPIEGEVSINYKSFQSVSEIMASGIPMKVRDEAGQLNWMQTGGMFELGAFSEGQAVQLKAGKEIEVSLVSTTEGNFDVWEYEEAVGNWKTIQKDHQATTEVAQNEALNKEVKQLKKVRANPPINPDNAGAYKLIFSDLDVSQCPSLKGATSVALTYIGTDETKDPKNNPSVKKAGTWYQKELKPLDAAARTFTLTLYGNQDIYEIPVKIALQGAELARAKARYEVALAAHKHKLRLLADKQALRKIQQDFRRTIRVSNLGIYNYDVLFKEEAVPFAAEFDFGTTGNIYKEAVVVYLITANNTVVVQLPADGRKSFRYYPNFENKLVAVLPGDQIATFSNKDFEAAADELKAAEGKSYVFDMELVSGQVTSVEDLQAIIQRISS